MANWSAIGSPTWSWKAVSVLPMYHSSLYGIRSFSFLLM